jgi:hypothetical protein
MNNADLRKIILDPETRWHPFPGPDNPIVHIFEGVHHPWRFLIVGTPEAGVFNWAGRILLDGTATHLERGLLIHLSRELLELAWEKATQKTNEP